MHKYAAFVVSFILSAHGKAVSSTGSHNSYGGFYSTIGLENMTPVERVKMEKGREKLEEGRCVVINPFLIKPVPWGTNAEHNQTSTKEKY